MSPPQEAAGQSGGVNISGTISAVHGDIVGGNKGLDAQEVVNALEALGMLQVAEAAKLQRNVIVMLAQRITPEVADFDQAVNELKRAVSIAVEVIERGERGSNHDDFVNAILARVAAETRRGNLDAGTGAVDEGLAELDAKYRSQRTTLLEEGIRVDTLRRDAPAVCRRIEMLVATDEPGERPAWLPAFRQRYDAYYEDGKSKGINFSLAVAIELGRRMWTTAQTSAEHGTAANLLGIALWRLGERESGTQRLEDAVAAYRAALQEWTRERVPLDWAMTQNNLGIALWRLGERESATTRLEEAVAAFRAALQEWTRERVPLDWAMTQNNLGNALWRLGERESATTRLEDAVAAYRAALQEWTRDRVPLDWAATQNSLGNALQTLGERESTTTLLEEAVAAYRAALEEWTRERAPLQWATTQNNLGNALGRLGEWESGTARLEEAVAAYRAALQECTRERVPLDWAATQTNLGNALQTLGERESTTTFLEEAVAAHRAALEEWTRERAPLQWAMTQNNLGNALATLGERTRDRAKLQQAREAISAAFDVYMQAGQEQYRDYFEERLRAIDRQLGEP